MLSVHSSVQLLFIRLTFFVGLLDENLTYDSNTLYFIVLAQLLRATLALSRDTCSDEPVTGKV